MNRKINPELLSAYLDGELSPEEVKRVEEELSYSPSLREKLAELKKIKEFTTTSIKSIPEAPYFETRLFAELDEKPFLVKIKKWVPAFGFTLLTIFIMILLKLNPDFINNIFEEQKMNLAGFYKENLKPLLFASELTNEDIFNFAFYNQLPLDNKKSQYIQLGSDKKGNDYFEINTAGFSAKEDNFKRFVETLSLSSKEQEQFDSLMKSYAEALQTQILVNDKNTIAISPNLWNYRKAIVADILAFAKQSSEEIANAFPVLFKVETPVVEKVVKNVKAKKDNEYIFFTPDTLFIDTFVFNEDEFNKEMAKVERLIEEQYEGIENQKRVMREQEIVKLKLDSSLIKLRKAPRVDKNINIYVDSNFCRVEISKIEIPDIELPDMDSLEAIINEAAKQVQAFSFKFDLPKKSSRINEFNFKFETDSLHQYNFNIPVPPVDSIIMERFRNFNMGHFPFQNDSIVKWFNHFKFDSTFTINPRDFHLRMKEFEEQMEKFKEEMEKLKKELGKDSVKVQSKKYIEI